MKIIDKIYNFKSKKPINSHKNIGIFLTQNTQNFPLNHPLIKRLLKIKNLELKFRNKPRDYMPNSLCNFYRDEMDTSELINWSDTIVSTQTSAILEALIKKKRVIFLEHLIPKSYGHWIKKYRNTVFLTKNDKDLINFIKNNYKVKNNIKYLKNCVGSVKENVILNNYLGFYKRLVK